MVTNKHGIVIDDVTFRKNKSIRVRKAVEESVKCYDRYVEMRHIVESYKSVVTPFDEAYIKELKSEGYKLVDDFKIYRLGG